jgi:hypothetical protein
MDPTAITPTTTPAAPPANNQITDTPRNVPSTRQAVTGVVPPEVGEAIIREVWPTLAAVSPGITTLAHKLMSTIVLAPVGWLLLAPLFLLRLAPGICRRYTLTNRRLMIQRGLKPSPVQTLDLREIDDVRVIESTRDPFYHSGSLEVLSGGKVVMTLPGVPEPEGFRRTVRNAVTAWVPGKPAGPFLSASAAKS